MTGLSVTQKYGSLLQDNLGIRKNAEITNIGKESLQVTQRGSNWHGRLVCWVKDNVSPMFRRRSRPSEEGFKSPVLKQFGKDVESDTSIETEAKTAILNRASRLDASGVPVRVKHLRKLLKDAGIKPEVTNAEVLLATDLDRILAVTGATENERLNDGSEFAVRIADMVIGGDEYTTAFQKLANELGPEYFNENHLATKTGIKERELVERLPHFQFEGVGGLNKKLHETWEDEVKQKVAGLQSPTISKSGLETISEQVINELCDEIKGATADMAIKKGEHEAALQELASELKPKNFNDAHLFEKTGLEAAKLLERLPHFQLGGVDALNKKLHETWQDAVQGKVADLQSPTISKSGLKVISSQAIDELCDEIKGMTAEMAIRNGGHEVALQELASELEPEDFNDVHLLEKTGLGAEALLEQLPHFQLGGVAALNEDLHEIWQDAVQGKVADLQSPTISKSGLKVISNQVINELCDEIKGARRMYAEDLGKLVGKTGDADIAIHEAMQRTGLEFAENTRNADKGWLRNQVLVSMNKEKISETGHGRLYAKTPQQALDWTVQQFESENSRMFKQN